MTCKVQTTLKSFQGTFTPKRGYIRIHTECREIALNAGHPSCDISCMAYFTSPTIAEFEGSMGRIRGDCWKGPIRQKFTLAAKPMETNQIRCGPSIQNRHALSPGVKNGAIHFQGRRNEMFGRIPTRRRFPRVLEENGDPGRGGVQRPPQEPCFPASRNISAINDTQSHNDSIDCAPFSTIKAIFSLFNRLGFPFFPR